MLTPARLIASADEIDNRLGPIPGRSSDRIAVELRAAAKIIATIPDTLADLAKTRSNLSGLSNSNDDVFAAMVRRIDAITARFEPSSTNRSE